MRVTEQTTTRTVARACCSLRTQADVAFEFYLGTHEPSWLWRPEFRDVPLFVSRRRLARRKGRFPRATSAWAMDSGGFTELSMHGCWTVGAVQYVSEIASWAADLGWPRWIAPQDWMCEPVILAKTGRTVEEHQALTVANFLELRALAPALGIVPVVQGFHEHEYLACVERYARAGVDLAAEPVVGIGTICRRQGTAEAEQILRRLAGLGLRCHAFGAKVTGLKRYAPVLASADSLAWSFRARKIPRTPGCTHNGSCANCPRWALLWRERLLAQLGGTAT